MNFSRALLTGVLALTATTGALAQAATTPTSP